MRSVRALWYRNEYSILTFNIRCRGRHRFNLVFTMEATMNTTTLVSALTTALWILIELIQFAYMAHLAWRNRNVNGRNTVGARFADSSA